MSEQQVLNYLKKLGKLTDEDIEHAKSNVVSYQLGKITDRLHAIACSKTHPKECAYYEEEVLDTRWEEPEHEKWSGLVRGIMTANHMTRLIEFEETLNEAIEHYKQISRAVHRDAVIAILRILLSYED